MNNKQIARAITALYALTSDGAEWTDTDELLQQAAFKLWEGSDADTLDMIVLLQNAGMGDNLIASFLDVTLATVRRAASDLQWIMAGVQ